jgi:hypothetical protein
MQDTRSLKTNVQRWVRGWRVRWFPCLRVGKGQGQGIGVLDAMRADMRYERGKKTAVRLRGGFGGWVPVVDGIAATGASVGM